MELSSDSERSANVWFNLKCKKKNKKFLYGIFVLTYKTSYLALLHGPRMFAVKAKINGVLYNQSNSIVFDETSSYW